MISSEILKIIEKLEFQTRKLLSGPLSGDYRSRLKGFGYDFDQLREYQPGDDIRYIDWKSSARQNQLLLKQYLDINNQTIFIAIDFSGSTEYGSGREFKLDLILKLSGILAFSSLHKKNSVGLIIFTDQIELFIPAKSSRSHIINLVNIIFTYKPKNRKTCLNTLLKYISTLKLKKSLVYIVSDFMDDVNLFLLRSLANFHEVIAFRCLDKCEIQLPEVGYLRIKDAETNEEFIITPNQMSQIKSKMLKRLKDQDNLFKRTKVDCFTVNASKNFELSLLRFFKQRIIR